MQRLLLITVPQECGDTVCSFKIGFHYFQLCVSLCICTMLCLVLQHGFTSPGHSEGMVVGLILDFPIHGIRLGLTEAPKLRHLLNAVSAVGERTVVVDP